MSALLRAEVLKLRTTRTFVALTGAAVGLSLLVTVLTTLIEDHLSQDDLRSLATTDFTVLFILLLGVMGVAGEFRHRTITSTILAAPDRVRLLAAKVIAYAAAGAVVSFAVTVSISIVSTVILKSRGMDTLGAGDLADVLWRNLVTAALLGAFGVVIGSLVRNQVVAVVGVLVVVFIVEPAIIALTTDVGRFGPTVGAPRAISAVNESEALAPGIGVLVMLGWITLGFAAGAELLRRRDLVV